MPAVHEHMSGNLLTVAADVRLDEAVKRMVERGVGAVLVVDGERLTGIFTERDVVKAVAAGYDDSTRVSDWMTPHPETIEPSESMTQAAMLMIHGGFRHLPVVDEGNLVGIVSIRDVIRVSLADEAPRGV